MKLNRVVAAVLLAYVTLFAPLTVRACPLCAEAIANANSGESDDDKDNFPAAMNQSIYLMLGVPYMAFGIFGLMIYRGCRKNDEFREGH